MSLKEWCAGCMVHQIQAAPPFGAASTELRPFLPRAPERAHLWAVPGEGAVKRVGGGADRDPPPLLRSAALTREARRAFGPLLTLIDDPALTDVMVQAHAGQTTVWVERGAGLHEVCGWDLSTESVWQLAVSLIAAGGRQLDQLHPCVDVTLAEGMRVHAVLPPVSKQGPTISIRLPRSEPLTFDQLITSGLCDDQVAERLREAVSQRQNLLLSGGTGSGKTTVLAALLNLAAPSQRVITIEDVAELRLTRRNWVALESRRANVEGAGEVTLDALLRESLRMRPDRIVLGECRGAEVATLLSALNTGHDGSAGTLHANRLEDVPARIEALGALAGLSSQAVARQAASALHLVVHLAREPNGRRVVAALGCLGVFEETLTIQVLR